MEILHLVPGQPPQRLDTLSALPGQGLVWIDILQPVDESWATLVEPLVQGEIDSAHIADSLNRRHPPFFDGTADYDMLVFEGLGPSDQPFPLETRSGALFLFDRVLVTVREPDARSYGEVKKRLFAGRNKCTVSPVLLTQMILDAMVDRFLRVREAFDARLTAMQDDLLDPATDRGDWRELLASRRQVRRLESLSEAQGEALDAWRRGSRFVWSQAEEVRLHDILGHVGRVQSYAANLERDVEAAVELHFATVSHRTNRIMRTLTVMSAIFFPLTLITGIYGMNFDNMPELHTRYGYFVVLGVLVTIAVTLLLLFKRRGFF